jgi:hypothetical protein
MERQRRYWKSIGGVVLSLGMAAAAGLAQQKTLPDAQIEANVLKSLASAPELADQAIGSSTVYGVVTLSGSVETEAMRDKAEQLVANTDGVKKVVDELTIGTPAPAQTGVSTLPQDQEDPNAQSSAEDQGPQTAASIPPPPASYSQNSPDQVEQPDGAPPAPPYPGYPSNPGYPPGPPSVRSTHRIQQQAGQSVIVPAGTIIRVRINQAMDSRHSQPGTPFDGVVLNDIFSDGMVAVPRGATVQGRVSDTQPGGSFRGRGGIALELTDVIVDGHTYPFATTPWSHTGYDKTGQTVGTTAGMGATGAMIGAIAGGGPGALLGAGLGAIAGLGVSSASRQGEAAVPSEAIVSFRLAQQTALTTVSQAELDRLGSGLPPPAAAPSMRRRYYPPPPPPYPYGPVYSPYPYYSPYYR